MVGDVDRRVNSFKSYEIRFNPITKSILIWHVLAVVVLCVTHCGTVIVISYAIVTASWGILRSQRTLRIKRDIRPTSQAAMNSTLVDERATVG